jgi:hypothetical protein
MATKVACTHYTWLRCRRLDIDCSGRTDLLAPAICALAHTGPQAPPSGPPRTPYANYYKFHQILAFAARNVAMFLGHN